MSLTVMFMVGVQTGGSTGVEFEGDDRSTELTMIFVAVNWFQVHLVVEVFVGDDNFVFGVHGNRGFDRSGLVCDKGLFSDGCCQVPLYC